MKMIFCSQCKRYMSMAKCFEFRDNKVMHQFRCDNCDIKVVLVEEIKKMRTCLNCKKEFEHVRDKQYLCSLSCYMEYYDGVKRE